MSDSSDRPSRLTANRARPLIPPLTLLFWSVPACPSPRHLLAAIVEAPDFQSASATAMVEAPDFQSGERGLRGPAKHEATTIELQPWPVPSPIAYKGVGNQGSAFPVAQSSSSGLRPFAARTKACAHITRIRLLLFSERSE